MVFKYAGDIKSPNLSTGTNVEREKKTGARYRRYYWNNKCDIRRDYRRRRMLLL